MWREYFNPRSYKRSDILPGFSTVRILIFQSTLLQEERLSYSLDPLIIRYISIHAPTRGATLRHISLIHSNNYFNPRSYKRSDPCTSSLCSGMLLFQSTLLQEERLTFSCIASIFSLFQSTLLQEERQGYITIYREDYVFQSTLLQEERLRS